MDQQKRDQTDANVSGAGTATDEKVSCPERTAETVLRLASMSLCVAALVVMAKNSVSNDFGSVSYSSLVAFKYLVNANGVCAGYSLLSALVSAMPRPPSMRRAWTFFFLDQVFTYAVLAAGAVTAEVVHLAYNGDYATAWSSACDSYSRFCHKASMSVMITFLVVVLYALLTMISSYRLFSKYSAPTTVKHRTGD